MSSPPYVELHVRSAFSFLRGGSLPERLAERAAELGYGALALGDRMGVYGAPRFRVTAKEVGLRPIYGAELAMEDGSVLPVLVENRMGYQHLCELLTRAHLRASKGEGVVRWEELTEFAEGLVALTGGGEGPVITALKSEGQIPKAEGNPKSEIRKSATTSSSTIPEPEARLSSDLGLRNSVFPRTTEMLGRLVATFGPRAVFIEIQRHHRRGEERINRALIELGQAHKLPLLATNGVLHATPEGRQVADVFTLSLIHI